MQSNPIQSITGSQSSLSVKAVTFGVCLAHRIKYSGLIDYGPGPGVQHWMKDPLTVVLQSFSTGKTRGWVHLHPSRSVESQSILTSTSPVSWERELGCLAVPQTPSGVEVNTADELGETTQTRSPSETTETRCSGQTSPYLTALHAMRLALGRPKLVILIIDSRPLNY